MESWTENAASLSYDAIRNMHDVPGGLSPHPFPLPLLVSRFPPVPVSIGPAWKVKYACIDTE